MGADLGLVVDLGVKAVWCMDWGFYAGSVGYVLCCEWSEVGGCDVVVWESGRYARI